MSPLFNRKFRNVEVTEFAALMFPETKPNTAGRMGTVKDPMVTHDEPAQLRKSITVPARRMRNVPLRSFDGTLE